MPGTLATDALAPELYDATVSADVAGSTAVEVAWPAECRFKLVAGTIDAGVTGLDVEVQGSDDSTFASGVVSYGRFDSITGSDDADVRYLQARVYKRYCRVVVDHTGTGDAPITVTVVEPHDHRVSTDSA